VPSRSLCARAIREGYLPVDHLNTSLKKSDDLLSQPGARVQEQETWMAFGLSVHAIIGA